MTTFQSFKILIGLIIVLISLIILPTDTLDLPKLIFCTLGIVVGSILVIYEEK